MPRTVRRSVITASEYDAAMLMIVTLFRMCLDRDKEIKKLKADLRWEGR